MALENAKIFDTRIQMKKDTSANWTQYNPVLLDGEEILVVTSSGEIRRKIGDGVKTYTQLPFTDENLRALISEQDINMKDGTGENSLVGNDIDNNIADGNYSVALGEGSKSYAESGISMGYHNMAAAINKDAHINFNLTPVDENENVIEEKEGATASCIKITIADESKALFNSKSDDEYLHFFLRYHTRIEGEVYKYVYIDKRLQKKEFSATTYDYVLKLDKIWETTDKDKQGVYHFYKNALFAGFYPKDYNANGTTTDPYIGATAMGYFNVAANKGAIAGGYFNVASDSAAIALGYKNTADGDGAVALGAGNKALQDRAIAGGQESIASGHTAVALGYKTNARAKQSTALGTQTVTGCYGYKIASYNKERNSVTVTEDTQYAFEDVINFKIDNGEDERKYLVHEGQYEPNSNEAWSTRHADKGAIISYSFDLVKFTGIETLYLVLKIGRQYELRWNITEDKIDTGLTRDTIISQSSLIDNNTTSAPAPAERSYSIELNQTSGYLNIYILDAVTADGYGGALSINSDFKLSKLVGKGNYIPPYETGERAIVRLENNYYNCPIKDIKIGENTVEYILDKNQIFKDESGIINTKLAKKDDYYSIRVANKPNAGTVLLSGRSALATGEQTQALGDYSSANGYLTVAAEKYAHAEGNTTEAGYSAHSEGRFTHATGHHSHAEGYSTEATADGAHAEGQNTTASGEAAHAEGKEVTAEGNYAHAEGYKTLSAGQGSHAEGHETIAVTKASKAGGYQTIAGGRGFRIEAINHEANSITLEGYADYVAEHPDKVFAIDDVYTMQLNGNYDKQGVITGIGGNVITVTNLPTEGLVPGHQYYIKGAWQWNSNITLDGLPNQAVNFTSNGVACNRISSVKVHNSTSDYQAGTWMLYSGYYLAYHFTTSSWRAGADYRNIDFGEAAQEISKEFYDYVLANSTPQDGGELSIIDIEIVGDINTFRVIEKPLVGNIDVAIAATAEGSGTKALGNYSTAEGYKTEAYGAYSHAEGYNTMAASQNQHVQGRYNTEDTEGRYAHIVGNGNSSAPSNAHTLDWSGNAWFAGDVTVGTTADKLATEKYVNDSVANLINSAPEALDTLNELSKALDNDPNFAATITDEISKKVDKIDGKGLSTNDFTNEEKTKLANLNEINMIAGEGEASLVGNDLAYNQALGDYANAQGNRTKALGNASHAEGSDTSAGTYGYKITNFTVNPPSVTISADAEETSFINFKVDNSATELSYLIPTNENTWSESPNLNWRTRYADKYNAIIYKFSLENYQSKYIKLNLTIGREYWLRAELMTSEGLNTRFWDEQQGMLYYTANKENREELINNSTEISSDPLGSGTLPAAKTFNIDLTQVKGYDKDNFTSQYLLIYILDINENTGNGGALRMYSDITCSYVNTPADLYIGDQLQIKLINDYYIGKLDSSNGPVLYLTPSTETNFSKEPNQIDYSNNNCSLSVIGRPLSGNIIISNPCAHAEGSETIATGYAAHAEGEQNLSVIDNQVLDWEEEYYTGAHGHAAHAEGYNTAAYSRASHAEGHSTVAFRAASHAEGYLTRSLAIAAHAEGYLTKSEGWASHAEGNGTIAEGFYSHAEGDGTTSSGYAAHAEGNDTIAEGFYSHAEGGGCTAKGQYSHAGGYHTIASGSVQMAIGYYNVEDTANEYAFIIGNGTSDSDRKNAFAVKKDGSVTIGSTTITEEQLKKLLTLLDYTEYTGGTI